MLYELGHTQGGLLPEIAQLLRWMDLPESSSSRRVSNGVFPQVNTGVTPDSVEIHVAVAGVDPESLDVSITNNILAVSGERKDIRAEGENTKFHLNEIVRGPFKRTISLPEDVDSNQVEANYRDGILHLSVKRKEQAKTRRITINTH
ncbi:MAG: Hsp20/alpha crystallin family protein [Methylococcales bacterium]